MHQSMQFYVVQKTATIKGIGIEEVWQNGNKPLMPLSPGWSTTSLEIQITNNPDGTFDALGIIENSYNYVNCTYLNPLTGKSEQYTILIGVMDDSHIYFPDHKFLGVRAFVRGG